MNEDVKTKTLQIRDYLYSLAEVKEYFRLKNAILENEELKQISSNIKKYCHDNDNKKLYEKYKKEYESHPLIINFNVVKNEVEDLLIQIKSLIEEEIL